MVQWGFLGALLWTVAALPDLPRTGVVLVVRLVFAAAGLLLCGGAVLLGIVLVLARVEWPRR